MNIASVMSAKALRRKAVVMDKERMRIQAYLLLALADVAVLSISFLTANLAYMGDLTSLHGVIMLSALVPIYVSIGSLVHAYSAGVLVNPGVSMRRSLNALISSAAAILLVAYILKAGDEFSRAVFSLGLLGSMVLIPLVRLKLHKPFLRMLGGSAYMTVVISDGVAYRGTGHEVVFSADELGFDPLTSDPHRYDHLAAIVSNADRVIVACPPDRYAMWALVMKSLTVKGEIFTDGFDELGVIAIGQHDDRSTMVVATGPLDLQDRMIKRAFDIAMSVGGLIVLCPMLVATAIAIKIDSKGPILFRQDRIGRDNRIFRVYKFRSMYTNQSDAGGTQLTTRNDSRVTRVGEFIRRTSIDELPQLFNVLFGDMSIVGPRPHPLSAKAADLLYWDVDIRYRHRHSIKPGLTGLAQVRGFRGNTERVEDLVNRLQADLEYAADWSLLRDIQIVLRTVLVLRHQNAY